MIEIIILVIGLIMAFMLGYYIGKSNKFSSNNLSQQTGLISQISEIKGMFAEIEKSRHRAEDMRDAQIQDMRNMMTTFTQTISGIKTRGMIGESILSEVLSNSIKAGVIKKELKIGSQNVEFAWDLGDGKYIPIDSKLPDVFSLVDQFEKSTETAEKKILSKKIKDKIIREILNIQKYQNQQNTIDYCILVVPPSVLDISPELISIGKNSNVAICSYKEVFLIAHILDDQYHRMKDEGDIGEYKKITKKLFAIFDKINLKSETIDRAVKQLSNANDEIKDEIAKSKRL